MALAFRFALPSDVDTYFNWVNEPVVRENSFNEKIIEYSDHVKWFESRLNSANSFLYLFLNEEKVPVGQVRIEKGPETVIDISLDKNFRGLSYASEMLRLAAEDFVTRFPDETIISLIKKSNQPSFRAFLKAGFMDITRAGDAVFKLNYKLPVILKKDLVINNTAFEITRADNADETSVKRYFELFYACFGFRQHLDREWFNWFYRHNPYGECNNYLLEDTSRAFYAGAYALAKSHLITGRRRIRLGVGVNGMVHSDYRKQGLYSEIIKTAVETDAVEAAVTYLHGSNRGTIQGHINAGWHVHKKIFFYATTRLSGFDAGKGVKEIFSFAGIKGVEDVLKPTGYSSYLEKTSDWLEWRFFERPHKKYTVLGHFDADEKINGYIVLSYYKNDKVSRCQVADYNALSEEVLSFLINSARGYAVANGCDTLDLWIDDQSREREFFIKHDFCKTDEFYEQLVFEKELDKFDLNMKTVLADLDAV